MSELGETLEKLEALVPLIGSDETLEQNKSKFVDIFLDLYIPIQNGLSDSDKTLTESFFKSSKGEITFSYASFCISLIEEIERQFYLTTSSVYQHDGWYNICLYRSAIEAFKECYYSYILVEALIPVWQLEEIDERIKGWAESTQELKTKRVDFENFPDSHWWSFYE